MEKNHIIDKPIAFTLLSGSRIYNVKHKREINGKKKGIQSCEIIIKRWWRTSRTYR